MVKGGQEWLCDPNYYKYKFEAFDEERVFALKKIYAKHMEIIKLLPYYYKVMGQKKDRANCATICCCQSGRVSKFAFLKRRFCLFVTCALIKSSSVLCQRRPLMSKFANQRKPKIYFFPQLFFTIIL